MLTWMNQIWINLIYCRNSVIKIVICPGKDSHGWTRPRSYWSTSSCPGMGTFTRGWQNKINLVYIRNSAFKIVYIQVCGCSHRCTRQCRPQIMEKMLTHLSEFRRKGIHLPKCNVNLSYVDRNLEKWIQEYFFLMKNWRNTILYKFHKHKWNQFQNILPNVSEYPLHPS